MKYFKVMAINKFGDEVGKRFDTKAEAEAYAKVCETNDCGAIMVVEYER